MPIMAIKIHNEIKIIILVFFVHSVLLIYYRYIFSISNSIIEISLKILKLWYTLKVVKKRGILTNEFTKTDVTFIAEKL